MTEPTKGNDHIAADQEAFQAAYARAKEFFKAIDGVVGVAFGQKQSDGEYKDDIAIVVFVREKKAEEDLPPEQRIPPSFEGYVTDVRVVQKNHLRACTPDVATHDPIQGGIQITPPGNPTTGAYASGTLACIVRKRWDIGRDNVYLLSNKHVLYSTWAGAGQYVYHPFSPAPAGFVTAGPSNALGPIQAPAFYGNEEVTVPDPLHVARFITDRFFVDCAIARIDIDSKCTGTICTHDTTRTADTVLGLQLLGADTIRDVRNVVADATILHQRVYKVGRTTGRTMGIVRLVNAPADVPGDEAVAGSARFMAANTIEIDFDAASDPSGKNCANHGWFSEAGDSGALILDEQGRAIGLVSAGPGPGSADPAPDHACHIAPILEKLWICIQTTGTSYGSTRATDGSGLVPAVPPRELGDFPMPDGQIVFVHDTVPGPLANLNVFREPDPVSEDEERHMRALLDEFRTTRIGRELHEVFRHLRREVGYLLRHCRPVTLAWHRNKGPAFYAHVMNHLKGYSDHVPREVDGVSGETLLVSMGAALHAHGSHPMRRAIDQYGDDVRAVIAVGNLRSVHDCIALLREREVS